MPLLFSIGRLLKPASLSGFVLAGLALLPAAMHAPAAMPTVEEGRKFWSLQPVKDPSPPAVKAEVRVRNEIDRFILAKLEEKNLQPAPPAEPLTLLRRLCYDLTGLPPSPEQVESFTADSSPEAYEKMVDELLASPRYGERWGRHWLDVARYADTAGDGSDYPVPDAARYRDWVIAAFNDNKPYDQFLKEQIAGDLLPAENEAQRHGQIIATGFIALSKRFGVNPDTAMNQTIEDTLGTLGQATMGLTIGCARCHDHKFDPVSAKDYYALYGIFSSTEYPYAGSEERSRPERLTPLIPAEELEKIEAPFKGELDRLQAEIDAVVELRKQVNQGTAPPGSKTNLQLLEEFRGLERRKREITDKIPDYPTAFAVAEGKAENARVQYRGEMFQQREEAPRGFLQVLGGQALPPEEQGSGRRQLAEWIADKSNPLTARVMVNRLWQQHFGKGIVATPNDFGRQGRAPTHPELLDWLAARFMEDGWDIKKMHRRILLSAAWRQSSITENPRAEETDPNNELLWRFNRRRVDAESLRDALLTVSGKLDLTPAGPHPFPPRQKWGWSQHNPYYAIYETNHRSVYIMQQRLKRHPFLAAFDGADPSGSTAERFVTTTPLQALFHLNNPFVHEQSETVAARLMQAEPADPAKRADLLSRLALGRPAFPDEMETALQYTEAFAAKLLSSEAPDTAAAEHAAWASYARAVLGGSEFSYID